MCIICEHQDEVERVIIDLLMNLGRHIDTEYDAEAAVNVRRGIAHELVTILVRK